MCKKEATILGSAKKLCKLASGMGHVNVPVLDDVMRSKIFDLIAFRRVMQPVRNCQEWGQHGEQPVITGNKFYLRTPTRARQCTTRKVYSVLDEREVLQEQVLRASGHNKVMFWP